MKDKEVSVIFNSPNLIHFRANLEAEDDLKLIEIYKVTNLIEGFYLLPVIENILELLNITNYDLQLIYFDDLDLVSLFSRFIDGINKVYNKSCQIEIHENALTVKIKNEVIYATNILC